MYRKRVISAIEFDYRNWELGFFVTIRVPFSQENWSGVFTIPGAANIHLVYAD